MDETAAFEDLRRDVDALGRALGEAIRTLSGDAALALVEGVRAASKGGRAGDPLVSPERLRAITRSLSAAQAETVVRAFSTFLHLANVAEELQRVRVNRLRERSSQPASPRAESFLALVGRLKADGYDYDQVVRLLSALRLHLTFTAHPTETRRRTLRRHVETIGDILERGDREALLAQVMLLWGTAELRREHPTVRDEVQGGLFHVGGTLRRVLPRLVDGLESAVEAHFGRRPSLPSPLVFRSWIGGDRDGNPNVTPATTAWAQDFAREQAVRRLLDDIDRLVRDLSVATERVPVESGFVAAAARILPELGLPDRFEGEPFRRFGLSILHRLRALLRDQPGPSYESAVALAEDLASMERALEAAGLHIVAALRVRPVRRVAEAFGLDLVSLDLREESSALRLAVAELLRVGGVCEDYAALDETAREGLLTRELASARPLAPVGYRPEGAALATALASLSAWRARGAHVVSLTRVAADLLDVLLLAREAGLYAPGRGVPFDVVPLFETLSDLDRSPDVVRRILANPVLRRQTSSRGGIEVMIGYSDSNKDAGYLAANWALYRAQQGISDAGCKAGVPVWYFHGRGTSTARGGRTAGRAIESLPPGTVGSRMRLTEQGEAVADRYGHPDLAYRNLEQLLYHLALASTRELCGEGEVLKPGWREAMDAAAARSAEAYRELLHRPGFFEFFEELTPIREIGQLRIASRPVSRSGTVRDVADLRAIPWVMSWTQVRVLLPGWYGLAEGLALIPAETRRQMWEGWPFFASTIDGAAVALAIADLRVAGEYVRLVRPHLADRFFPTIADAYQRTIALIEETTGAGLLARHPVLARQRDLRNPYVDPISLVQVELLDRFRRGCPDPAERASVERVLMLSLLGIAAGLRNAG